MILKTGYIIVDIEKKLYIIVLLLKILTRHICTNVINYIKIYFYLSLVILKLISFVINFKYFQWVHSY